MMRQFPNRREVYEVPRQAPKDLEKKKKAIESAKPSEKSAVTRKAEGAAFGYTNIIEATPDDENLTYRPCTTKPEVVGHSFIDDQAQDIVRRAADTVLKVLRTDSTRLRQQEVESRVPLNENLSKKNLPTKAVPHNLWNRRTYLVVSAHRSRNGMFFLLESTLTEFIV
jgi:hypothetical protein